MRRLAWYTLGIGGILAILWIHPNPTNDLYLGLGDRLSAIMLGLAYGAIGTAIAIGHRPLPLPHGAAATGGAIPGGDPQRDRDRVLRRGGVPGPAVRLPARPPGFSRTSRTSSRRWSTRWRRGSGRPGDRGTCCHRARDRPRRRLAGRDHGRHRGGVPRPLDHAGRDLPHHRPFGPAEGQGHRERGGRPAAGDAQGLAGARLRARRPATSSPAAVFGDRGATAPRPPVALYVHVPFCVSLCPYCDFVVYAGAAARGPRARVEALRRRAADGDRPAGGRGRR